MSGQRKSPLVRRACGLTYRLVRLHVAIRDAIIVIFCGVGQSHQAIRLHPVSGSVCIDSADCPFVSATASNLNFASGFFHDEFCDFNFDLLDCRHVVHLLASGFVRSYASSINQMFGIVNRQFEAI